MESFGLPFDADPEPSEEERPSPLDSDDGDGRTAQEATAWRRHSHR